MRTAMQNKKRFKKPLSFELVWCSAFSDFLLKYLKFTTMAKKTFNIYYDKAMNDYGIVLKDGSASVWITLQDHKAEYMKEKGFKFIEQ